MILGVLVVYLGWQGKVGPAFKALLGQGVDYNGLDTAQQQANTLWGWSQVVGTLGGAVTGDFGPGLKNPAK